MASNFLKIPDLHFSPAFVLEVAGALLRSISRRGHAPQPGNLDSRDSVI